MHLVVRKLWKSEWGMTYEAVTLREHGVFEEVWGSEDVMRGGVDVDESRTRRWEDRRVGGRSFGGDDGGDGGGDGDGTK